MCDAFKIARDTVQVYLAKKTPFTFEEVQDAILEKGGVLRVAPGVGVVTYLKKFEERNIIRYNYHRGEFYFLDSLPHWNAEGKFNKIEELLNSVD